ncbi:hypothetical protein AB0J63_45440 [Streptosporangium canum]|uniref:hypothetical protein n=1 Tax=Streptosporangium canum TaxID=324952 RepID=UPI003424DF55
MTHDLADNDGSGWETEDPASLPRRSDALRCPHTETGRRCVLPPRHELEHVYPHQKAAAL